MADEKIIFSMVGVSKTFPPQKRVLNNIYLSFFYGAKIGIIGCTQYNDENEAKPAKNNDHKIAINDFEPYSI